MLDRFNHFLASLNHISGHRAWWLGWFLGVLVVLVWLVAVLLIPVLDHHYTNTKYYLAVLSASPLALCGATLAKCSWNFALGWKYWYIDGMGVMGFVGQRGRRYEVCGWEK